MHEEITFAEMARGGTRRRREEDQRGEAQEQATRDKRSRKEVDPPDTGGATVSGTAGGEGLLDEDGDISMGALCALVEYVRESRQADVAEVYVSPVWQSKQAAWG